MAKDAVAIVEAAYSLADGDREWLANVTEAARPLLDDGLGVISFFFDTRRPSEDWIEEPITLPLSPDYARAIVKVHQRRSEAERVRPYLQNASVRTSSEIYASGAEEHAPVAEAAVRFGFADFLRVQAKGAGPFGCVLGAPLRTRRTTPASTHARWDRLTAHIGAGLRLRRALAEPVAVLDDRRRLQHQEEELPADTVERLRRAALDIDRARGSLRLRDPERALASWQALVDGRWSLVDRFDNDGRRFWIVHRNDGPIDPRGLTEAEQRVAKLLALGASNKAVGVELAIAEGTVAAHVAALRSKLGVRSRAALVSHLAAPSALHTSPLGARLSVIAERSANEGSSSTRLTPAEREVARAAASGASNEAIARQRGTSIRTVANQLQSIFAKLEIGSRAALARHARHLRG